MRIVFDLTTSVDWSGNPVGIVRSERSIARWAHGEVRDIVFVYRDPVDGCYHEVRREVVPAVLNDGVGAVWHAPDNGSSVVQRSVVAVSRMVRLRRQTLLFLERWRRHAGPSRRNLIETVQRRLMRPQEAEALQGRHGGRTHLFSHRELFSRRYIFDGSERFILAGIHWLHHTPQSIGRLRAIGTHISLLCYDVIPALFPQYYDPVLWRAFHQNVDVLFREADRMVFTATRARADALEHCPEPGDGLRNSVVLPLGADLPRRRNGYPDLPGNLEPGRFALFVSTVEPRKGHDLLCRVWEDLLADGAPELGGFKLVFVGMRGELSAALAQAFERLERAGALVYLPNAGDGLLARLYADAAFCLFPSEYEGYGLPVVEAFCHGKPVIASDGGSLPEVVGDFSPCLPVGDDGTWKETIRQWISDPAVPARHAADLRTRYRPVTWTDAAARIFAALT